MQALLKLRENLRNIIDKYIIKAYIGNNIGLSSRITRDITDGLIVLDLHGNIVLSNKSAIDILGNEQIGVGTKYAEIMMADENSQNDAFHQFLLDAIYDKNKPHFGNLVYFRPDGSKRVLHVVSSFLFREDMTVQEGAVIQISDITEVATLKEKVDDSAKVFVILMSALCLWVITCYLWEIIDNPISDTVMTQVVEFFGIGLFYYLYKYTSITIRDMGLGIKNLGKAICFDVILTAICLTILVAIKLYMIRTGYFDASEPFLLFNEFDWACWIYPLTVVIQEFLTRGVIHESIRRIIPGKYSTTLSIIVSSLFFATLHIYKGLVFTAGAFCLLSIFGIMYNKQKSIWGLCIPHLMLGWAITLLFGV